MTALRTTHTGSLPRPRDLAERLVARERGDAAPDLDERVRAAVGDVVRRQVDAGIDVVGDGEMGKVGYAVYVKDRLTGFDGESAWLGERRPEMDEHPDFVERWRASMTGFAGTTPACTSDIRVRDADAIHTDIANLRSAAAAAGAPEDRLFMTAASPGLITTRFANLHYPSQEAYLTALAEAMRSEYEAIVHAGIVLQIDCPDLAMSRHSVYAHMTLEEFRREAALHVDALNHAVAALPADRMRFHVCWGNYDGPHTHDVPLRDIVDVVLRAKPAGIVLESCNPRHAHEWRVWDDVRLPDDRYLVAGVIDSTNNYVEHPEAVAQRLLRFARVVGPERVMGGSDCGFGTNVGLAPVAPSITWAKLRSLAEGARLASAELVRA